MSNSRFFISSKTIDRCWNEQEDYEMTPVSFESIEDAETELGPITMHPDTY